VIGLIAFGALVTPLPSTPTVKDAASI
jgi:hypothetical protein